MRDELATVSTAPSFAVRLPTEMQWERAARSDDPYQAQEHRWPFVATAAEVPHRANVRGSGIETTSGVGVFAPNNVGVYDFAGNTWEWMDNAYDADDRTGFVRVADGESPKGPLSLRGGSWFDRPELASCSSRSGFPPSGWYNFMGFRVVLSLAKNEN